MPEPNRLLHALRNHLTDHGGIHCDSILELIDIMKCTKGKLVPKCISLWIIASSTPEVQLQLCSSGAWDLLLKWLQEALKENNYPFLMELLGVYLQLPIRVEHLKQNVCAKLLNSLTKRSEHEGKNIFVIP